MRSKFVCFSALVAFVMPLVGCAHTAGSADAVTPSTPAAPVAVSTAGNPPALNGRALFLHNCAHCHGADATGDEGPDLHHLELTDDWIANRIRKGKAGQMTAFAGKLSSEQINVLVTYVQHLK